MVSPGAALARLLHARLQPRGAAGLRQRLHGPVLNGTYHTGSLVDVGCLVSYVLWGTAALHPSMNRLSEPGGGEQLRVGRGRPGAADRASLLAPGRADRGALRGSDPSVFTTVAPDDGPVRARDGPHVGACADPERARSAATKQPRSAGAQSEERFGSLVQHSSDLVTVTDAEGMIAYQSPSVQRSAGLRPPGADRARAVRAGASPMIATAVRHVFRDGHAGAARPARPAGVPLVPSRWRLARRGGDHHESARRPRRWRVSSSTRAT